MIFRLIFLLFWSCQLHKSFANILPRPQAEVLPNVLNATNGDDDNQLERDVLPNVLNSTNGDDDNQLERADVLPNVLNATNGDDDNQLEREDELPNMTNETRGLDDFQQDGSNRSTRAAHSNVGTMYLDGGYWGGWGSGHYCLFPHFAYKMELKIESKQGGSDDTALNAIRLTCTDGKTITSAQSGWGSWRGVKSCSSNNYIKSATIRREVKQGGGDDTAANGVKFGCTDGKYHYPGDGYWGEYQSWQYCPSGSAVYGLQTQIEHDQGGSDDTALNDVKLSCARLPGCSGYRYQWECCTASSPCGVGKGDCDRDYDCSGSLICGTNNCKSFNSMADSAADCCIKPRCSGYNNQWECCTPSSPCGLGQGDCDTDSDCSGSLICGAYLNNCKSFDSGADSAADCCIKPPIHGGWSSWGSCSKSCRYGTSYGYQYRYCTNPRPQHGGRSCSGSSSRKCNENVCCPDNSVRMAKQTTYLPTPTKSCPTLPEPTPCPTTACLPIPTCPPIPTCSTNSTIGSTPFKTIVTKPPTTPSCKPSKKCEKKNGKCFGKGDTVPKHAKRKGWCSKKTNCKCYKV